MEPWDKRDRGSLLDWGKKYLKEAGIEDPSISAELLLGSLLKATRSELLLGREKIVPDETIREFQELIHKRAARVPPQYLTGSVEFYNIMIKCDPRALIPRPETEILIETVIDRLKDIEGPRILDIGAGSGNIAIALAKNIAGCRVTGVDISQEALDLAGENIILNKAEENIILISGDIADKSLVKSLGRYDCAVSNPPYVAESDKGSLPPEVIDFEPHKALFGPDDGLGFFRIIIDSSSDLLRSNGLLAFEAGMGQTDKIAAMMKGKFSDIEIRKDLAGIDRVITGIFTGNGKEIVK